MFVYTGSLISFFKIMLEGLSDINFYQAREKLNNMEAFFYSMKLVLHIQVNYY